ncbi:TPA: DUF905 family protein [Citrobacter freundii]
MPSVIIATTISQLIWRNWNYEPDAYDALNSHLQSHGLKAS